MRLKSLEMTGFKSFSQRTILQFTPGITAVVGPNGCGKSNIVDALRWVMGEQSARHLRGHLMEDVIFGGSDSQQPLGMAEVSLILDNEDGRGPAEYSGLTEIMVTRRLFRSGESEYAINKVPCRLKDIIELFLGTGVGNKAYSIVEQGRVDELVNSKPEERRALIEEASGTSKYKSRKLMAERKVERTQQNLVRVNDIVREIERQIRSLELQAKKAERYKAIKGELKEKELCWASRQRKSLEEEISGRETELKGQEDRLVEIQAALHSKEAEGEGLRLALLEAEKEISSGQEAVYRRKVEIQGEEQRIDFNQRDLAGLHDLEQKTRAELGQMEERLGDLSLEIEELKKAQDNFVQLFLFEESNLREKEKELERIKLQIHDLQGEIDREKETLIETANQISQLRNDLAASERRREELHRQLSRNEREGSELLSSLQSRKEKGEQRKAALDSALKRAEEIEKESGAVAASLKEWGQARENQERKIEGLKARLQESRSRLLTLQDLQKNYEGYQEGVRAIMLRRKQEPAFEGVHGLVADVIEAPEPYERALTAVLGDRLQYVIVQSHKEGLEAIDYLKRESTGRGTFVPYHVAKRAARPLPLAEPEVVAPLLEMVSVKEGYRGIAEYLLSDVVVVRSLQSGLDLWSRNGFRSTLVTPEGEVIDPMGVVTGGSLESLEANPLSQRRKIRELDAVIAEFELELHKEERESQALMERVEQTENRKSLLIEEGHKLALDRVGLEHDLNQAEQETEQLGERLEMLRQEREDLSGQLQSVEREIQECQAAMEGRLKTRAERETALADKQSKLSELAKELERLESEATESRVRGAALGERKENTHRNLENRIRSQDELSAQIQYRRSHLEEMGQRRERLKQAIRASEGALAEIRKALEEAEATLEAGRARYKEISRRLAEVEEAVKELRPLGEASQEEKNRLQLVLSETRLHLQHLCDSIREKYDLDLREYSPETPEREPSREELLAEIEELRGRLERMGEVNLAAIGEFEELNGRYQFLSRQKEDLEKSLADLQRTIAKLNRICRLRFKESFEEINQRFEEIFPRLFRGGKARLVLTDENDYLETGIDIVAQPPGKKLQSVTLLSGGEKALTAVSLLFAIFLTKPSPFCFLDEVDAPLDDANIDRFNEMIQEMAQTSQFILITHNKRTMQAAEVLYGITMAEPGVSKVVSVRMS